MDQFPKEVRAHAHGRQPLCPSLQQVCLPHAPHHPRHLMSCKRNQYQAHRIEQGQK